MSRLSVVLLHGALQSNAVFASTLPHFETVGDEASVTALDLVGHGGRAVPERLDVEDLARDVLNQLDEHNVSAAHLFGYSLGGYVALHLARHHPERVRSVFAHATKLAWTPEVAAREAANLDPDALRARAAKFAAALERTHAPADWEALARRFADLMCRLGAFPAVTLDDLRAVTVPVQLSVGDRDALVTIEETVEAYRALANGRLHVRPGVPHVLGALPPESLAREIAAFARELA